jgi:dUTP pyrophosphatase
VKRVHPRATIPAYATPDSAGLDLTAALDAPVSIAPGQRALVPTGLAFAIARGFEGQVRPRSGLALKQGLTVLNAPGTIDADYRGEVSVVLINHGVEPVRIAPGDRIAQLVIAPVLQATLTEVSSLDETARGAGGFGSTGIGSP